MLEPLRHINYPSAAYTNQRFVDKIANKDDVKVIIEVGARDLIDTLELEKIYKNATIYSFECNPECVEVCKHNLQFSAGRIKFFNIAASDTTGEIEFYSFDSKNCEEHEAGVSSLFQHNDTASVPMNKITVQCTRLADFATSHNILCVDILCMDVQGAELNVLQGLSELINTVKYIVCEFDGSAYIGAPEAKSLADFIESNNYVEIDRECHDRLYVRNN